MPSELVDEVRRLIRRRTEEGRPVTMPERALLLATLAPPRRQGGDVVDELEAAIAAARYTLAESHAEHRPAAIKRLLAAARAVLDYAPAYGPDPDHDPAAIYLPPDPRRKRADVDG